MGFWPRHVCEHISASGRRVIRYCHRDSSKSTHFDEPYTIQVLLADMMALIEMLSSSAVHLVGHSMGGYLAQLAMCSFPNKVLSVTSISAGSTVSETQAKALGMSSATEETWSLLMENQPKGIFDDDLSGWIQSWRFLNGTVEFDEQAAAEYTRLLYVGDRRNAEVAVNHIHAMSTVPEELVSELKRCDRPLLVIHGTEDPLVPLDNAEVTASLALNSKLRTLDGAGHMFFNNEVWNTISLHVLDHTNPSA